MPDQVWHDKLNRIGVNPLADILVVAAHKPSLILPQRVRTGAAVIVAGIHRLPDGRLVGDVDFEGVRQRASDISPAPGGVGPVTAARLVHNTVMAARRCRIDPSKNPANGR